MHNYRSWSPEDESLLRRIYPDRTVTKDRLEQSLHRSISSIRSRANKLGITRRKWSPAWCAAEDKIIRTSYLELPVCDVLQKLPGRTWSSIVARASRLHVGSRAAAGYRPRKYHWNFDYFEKIDTEEKAYWLGFIYADGSLNDRNVFCMGLVVDGFRHMTKFAAAIEYDGEIKPSEIDTGIRYFISLSHPKFARDLKTKGVVPRKTWRVQFPYWLDKDLIPHFIRGLFDGDGSVYVKNNRSYKYPAFYICGGVKKFIDDVATIMTKYTCVQKNKVSKDKTKNCWRIAYGGIPALKIRDWFYAGATVWMEYKKEIFDSFVHQPKKPAPG